MGFVSLPWSKVSQGISTKDEVCRGSSEGVSTSGANDVARYIELKKRYQNCTYVDGNLEIKFLEQGNETFDLSFLSKIEEVSGYVLITSVVAETIPLTSLKIIRGNQLFNYKNHSYSLFVGVNNNETRGLKELLLTNLSGPPCAPECFENETKNYHCWGSGPNKCQKLIREICHKSCETGCFGYAISECCHSQCAGGCTWT
uniref:Uncharacterized protein n=1 Tax=Magallana gigas TaxID=29159 RepID=A0A8W8KRF1_MAGGI